MGLFDLFRKEPAPEPTPAPMPADPPAGRSFGFEPERMFDIGLTHDLAQLFAIPREQREAEWVSAFYRAAWWGSVELPDPQVCVGPDGLPYLRLNLPQPDTEFKPQCLANLAGTCLENGIGAAFFASPDEPAEASHFVLSLGLIDSLVRYDSPNGDPIDLAESSGGPDEPAWEESEGLRSRTLVADQGQEVLVATPSAEFLPPYIAAALLRHLEEGWGLPDPRVQLLIDSKMRPHRNLVIGRKRSEFSPGESIDDMARVVLWFLTPSRSILLMPEEWELDDMIPLRELAGG